MEHKEETGYYFKNQQYKALEEYISEEIEYSKGDTAKSVLRNLSKIEDLRITKGLLYLGMLERKLPGKDIVDNVVVYCGKSINRPETAIDIKILFMEPDTSIEQHGIIRYDMTTKNWSYLPDANIEDVSDNTIAELNAYFALFIDANIEPLDLVKDIIDIEGNKKSVIYNNYF